VVGLELTMPILKQYYAVRTQSSGKWSSRLSWRDGSRHVGSNTVGANRRMAERALHNIALAEAGAFEQMDLLNPDVLKRAGRSS
jgi:hypothetical protein